MTNYVLVFHVLPLFLFQIIKCILKSNVKLDLLWTMCVIDANHHFASIICSVYLKSDTDMTRYYTLFNSWCHISQVTYNFTEIPKSSQVLFGHVKYTVKYKRDKELVIPLWVINLSTWILSLNWFISI